MHVMGAFLSKQQALPARALLVMVIMVVEAVTTPVFESIGGAVVFMGIWVHNFDAKVYAQQRHHHYDNVFRSRFESTKG